MAKSTKPIVRIHNTETNEVIDREMNDEEFASYQLVQADYLAIKSAEAEKAASKQAILDRLGLTAEEAALLFS
jgi:hypothetical protein